MNDSRHTFARTATVSAEELRRIYFEIAQSLGASPSDAAIYANCFLRADLRHDTQGLCLFLEWSLPMAEARSSTFDAQVRIKSESPSSLSIDGGGGIGQVVASKSMERVIAKSKATGVAVGVIHNVTDVAMAANYAMQALPHDCIGVAASTAPPAHVAIWGGRDPVFGPDPLSVAVPTAIGPPVVIDMCCAGFSIGTLVEAARSGHKSANPVVVGTDGVYSRDPSSIISDIARREPTLFGAILPEGPKGSALLLLVEVLAGLLSGAGPSVAQPFWSFDKPPKVGIFLCSINLELFTDVKSFKSSVSNFVDLLRDSRQAQGFASIVVPGLRAAASEMERLRSGIPISERHMKLLAGACARHQVNWERQEDRNAKPPVG